MTSPDRQSKSKRPWWVGPDRPPRWYEALFVLGFFGVFAVTGVVLLILAINQGIDSTETEGTVIAIEAQGHGRESTYCALVEYRVNETQYFCRGVASNPPCRRFGEKVRVLYRSDKPDVGYVNTFLDRWLGAMIFFGGGVPLLVWAVFSLFFSRMFSQWLQRRSDDR